VKHITFEEATKELKKAFFDEKEKIIIKKTESKVECFGDHSRNPWNK
jgi:hypothetical protein